MFHTSVRVSPCSDRCTFDSLGRSTTTRPSLTETRICGFRFRLNSDLPLVTTTAWPEMLTVTHLRLLTGSLPILLIAHQTQHTTSPPRPALVPFGPDITAREVD